VFFRVLNHEPNKVDDAKFWIEPENELQNSDGDRDDDGPFVFGDEFFDGHSV